MFRVLYTKNIHTDFRRNRSLAPNSIITFSTFETSTGFVWVMAVILGSVNQATAQWKRG